MGVGTVGTVDRTSRAYMRVMARKNASDESFATPLVSGAIAQLMTRDPSLNSMDAANMLLADNPLWWADQQPPPGGGDFDGASVINPPALWP